MQKYLTRRYNDIRQQIGVLLRSGSSTMSQSTKNQLRNLRGMAKNSTSLLSWGHASRLLPHIARKVSAIGKTQRVRASKGKKGYLRRKAVRGKRR